MKEKFEKRNSSSGFQYLLHIPELKDSLQKLPLLFFLHGAGERGDNLDIVKRHGPPRLIEDGENLGFIVVAPQCPANTYWSTTLLKVLLDEIIKEVPVDVSRIYLTGISMGGYGTWQFASMYPDMFAAIAPICGGGKVDQADRLKEMSIWAFHGAKDTVVPVSETIQMVEAVKAENTAEVLMTIYPEAEHDSWTETYYNGELYAWFLNHQKQS